MTSAHEDLLGEFQDFSKTAPTAHSLMEQMAKRLHQKMTRYNWTGFYRKLFHQHFHPTRTTIHRVLCQSPGHLPSQIPLNPPAPPAFAGVCPDRKFRPFR